MQIGMSQSLRQSQTQEITLASWFGEKFGDIPLFSLHRIKSLLLRSPIAVKPRMQTLLVEKLFELNEIYKEESGNDWCCLTALNMTAAFERLDESILQGIDAALGSQPKELMGAVAAMRPKLIASKDAGIEIIRKWFDANSEQLVYITDGKIPWAVVAKLRAGLSVWKIKQASVFDLNIDDAILQIAAERNINEGDPIKAWKKMGGRVFTKETAD